MLRAPAGIRHGTGLYVLTLTGDQICALTASATACSHGSGCRDRSRADSQLPDWRSPAGRKLMDGAAAGWWVV
jgi:hypothetical protein